MIYKTRHQLDSQYRTEDLEDLIEAPAHRSVCLETVDSDTVDRVLKCVDSLPERDALVLRLRFGLGGGHMHTLQEVGDRLGLTKARVCQLEKAALRKLRDLLLDAN
jgi:RNA polymerase sigma factor (sigma-70 family)